MVDERRAARLAWAIRAAAFSPLLVAGAVYAFLPQVRGIVHEGCRLLFQGDVAGLREWGGELGAWAPLATLLLMVVQALAFPIPAVIVTWTNSLLFGWFIGGLYSIFSATLAATLCFALGRLFGEPLVTAFVSRSAVRKANEFMAEHGTLAILIARLMPLVPFDPISYVAGVTRMRVGGFFLATFVGQIPAGFAYSYLGQDIGRPAQLALKFATAVLALLVLGFAVRRFFGGRPRAQGSAQEVDNEGEGPPRGRRRERSDRE